MTAQSRVHCGVDVAPLFAADTLRRPERTVYGERRRVEADVVLVASVAEPEQVVEALVENAESRHLAAGISLSGEHVGRQLFRGTKLAGDAARRQPNDGGHVDVGLQVAHGTWHGENRAFGFAVQGEHCAVEESGQLLQTNGVVLVVEPADLLVDALDRFPIARVIVVEDRHRSARSTLMRLPPPWLPRRRAYNTDSV